MGDSKIDVKLEFDKADESDRDLALKADSMDSQDKKFGSGDDCVYLGGSGDSEGELDLKVSLSSETAELSLGGRIVVRRGALCGVEPHLKSDDMDDSGMETSHEIKIMDMGPLQRSRCA